MYINAGKRAILIFPKFKNIAKIQEVRNRYDVLADFIAPHITLAFPFSNSISNEDLLLQLSNILKPYSPFKVTFAGTSLSHDNYIFLDCIEGKDKIISLHNDIYKNIIPSHLKKDIPYIPHITLGQADNLDSVKCFNYRFETIIDEVSIELIGDTEESILIGRIKLEGIL